MPAKNNIPPRDYHIALRKAAFAGARISILDRNRGLLEIAKQVGTSRHSITMAVAVLAHGTEAEIAGAESGQVALRTLYETITKRIPSADRKTAHRPPTQTDALVGARQVDADVWQNLKKALEAILSLPAAKDTADIVRRNPMRMEYTNRSILVALTWITEFSDEITR